VIPAILAALKFAPAVFSASKAIFSAVTGEPVAGDETHEDLASRIQSLPPEQQAAVTTQILAFKAEVQALDTERFIAMTESDAEKVKATARPKIARRAMGVLESFAWVFKVLVIATVVEWAARAICASVGVSFPVTDSLPGLIAELAPAAEMIWAPLIVSFATCASVIRKYMGCRERDKAQQYEMMAGRPLGAAASTVEAAGEGIAGLIKTVRGK